MGGFEKYCGIFGAVAEEHGFADGGLSARAAGGRPAL